MKFKLMIDLDGAAFAADESLDPLCHRDIEIARILKTVREKLLAGEHDGAYHGIVRDVNGNTCGAWVIGDPKLTDDRDTSNPYQMR